MPGTMTVSGHSLPNEFLLLENNSFMDKYLHSKPFRVSICAFTQFDRRLCGGSSFSLFPCHCRWLQAVLLSGKLTSRWRQHDCCHMPVVTWSTICLWHLRGRSHWWSLWTVWWWLLRNSNLSAGNMTSLFCCLGLRVALHVNVTYRFVILSVILYGKNVPVDWT